MLKKNKIMIIVHVNFSDSEGDAAIAVRKTD